MMHGGHYSGYSGYVNPFTRPMNWEALGKFDNITPHVQQHLMRWVLVGDMAPSGCVSLS